MSLNHEQRARTARDLRRHLDASGLSSTELGEWLGMDAQLVEDIVAMNGSGSPADTWLVRDALESVTRERTDECGEWAVLTDEARNKANQWYTLRRVPPRPAGSAR